MSLNLLNNIISFFSSEASTSSKSIVEDFSEVKITISQIK